MRVLSTVLMICVSAAACAAVMSPTLPAPEWPDREAAVAVFTAWRHAPPAWSFDPLWDTVRVVSAGSDDADGRVRVEIGPDGTLFIMR